MNKTPVHPRPAASILLIRDGAAGLEVFMVVRHHMIAFAPNAQVFPGGRVDKADHDLVPLSSFPELAPDSVPFRVAAIREAYEECGILLARHRVGGQYVAADRVPGFARLDENGHAKPEDFPNLLKDEDLVPAVDALVPYSHWITPVFSPMRFDTHFFLAVAPPGQEGCHDGREAVDSLWASPAQTIAEAEAGKRRVEFPTRMNLRPLLGCANTTEAMVAARARQVVTVVPELVASEGKRFTLRIPQAAGYGAEIYDVEA